MSQAQNSLYNVEGGPAHPVHVTNDTLPALGPGASEIGIVEIEPFRGIPTNRSGTITAGGVAQSVANVNAARRYFFFQNVSLTMLFISFVGVASTGTIQIPPGASYENPAHFCPTGAISVFGATTGQAFRAMEA